jgi:hypothetical protein
MRSQSTIKMDKGYYNIDNRKGDGRDWGLGWSQSTIKMDKGYYKLPESSKGENNRLRPRVAIHNKNGQGLLHAFFKMTVADKYSKKRRNPQ